MLYAVVDIETTGGKFNQEHIMEIAVFLYDGEQVIDQFISLVNPEKPIQKYVSKITGITEKMVARAPKFYELAKRLIQITEGAVFVAHNVKFDYRVVQLEFERLGYEYHRKTLDTIDLTKQLIPDLESYGLEKVCAALGISNTHRHRADGDARATVELLQILLQKDAKKRIAKLSSSVEESKNQHPFRDVARQLKNTVGVYYLYNAQGKVIYISRGVDLQNSINRHFLATNQLALNLQNEAANIGVEKTGNEAVAQIKAFAEWRHLKPKYNTGLPTKFLPIGLFVQKEGASITLFKIRPVRQKAPLLYFKNDEEAAIFLASLLVEKNLNAQAMLMERDFELLKKVNQKVEEAKGAKRKISAQQVRAAFLPHAEGFAIGPGKSPTQRCLIYVKNHRVRGFAYFTLSDFVNNIEVVKNHLTTLSLHPFSDGVLRYFLGTGTFKLQEVGVDQSSPKK